MCTIALGRARLEETGLQGYGPLSGAWGRMQEGWLRGCFFQFSFSKAEEDSTRVPALPVLSSWTPPPCGSVAHHGPGQVCPRIATTKPPYSPWVGGVVDHQGGLGCLYPKKGSGYSQQDDRAPNQSRGSHPKPPQHHRPQELWVHSRAKLSCPWGMALTFLEGPADPTGHQEPTWWHFFLF